MKKLSIVIIMAITLVFTGCATTGDNPQIGDVQQVEMLRIAGNIAGVALAKKMPQYLPEAKMFCVTYAGLQDPEQIRELIIAGIAQLINEDDPYMTLLVKRAIGMVIPELNLSGAIGDDMPVFDDEIMGDLKYVVEGFCEAIYIGG